jgi:signal peptidase II
MAGTTQENKRLVMRGRPWLWLLLSLGGVALDQLTKWLCVHYLQQEGASVSVIPGLLKFTYIQNQGAAFGSFSEHRWVFMIFSTIAIIGVTCYLLFLSEQNRWLRASLALIISGGIGNMIDRISLGYVIDMIDFYVIWPYIFNVADSFVCVGAAMMVLYCGKELYLEYQQSKTASPATCEHATDDENGDAT